MSILSDLAAKGREHAEKFSAYMKKRAEERARENAAKGVQEAANNEGSFFKKMAEAWSNFKDKAKERFAAIKSKKEAAPGEPTLAAATTTSAAPEIKSASVASEASTASSTVSENKLAAPAVEASASANVTSEPKSAAPAVEASASASVTSEPKLAAPAVEISASANVTSEPKVEGISSVASAPAEQPSTPSKPLWTLDQEKGQLERHKAMRMEAEAKIKEMPVSGIDDVAKQQALLDEVNKTIDSERRESYLLTRKDRAAKDAAEKKAYGAGEANPKVISAEEKIENEKWQAVYRERDTEDARIEVTDYARKDRLSKDVKNKHIDKLGRREEVQDAQSFSLQNEQKREKDWQKNLDQWKERNEAALAKIKSDPTKSTDPKVKEKVARLTKYDKEYEAKDRKLYQEEFYSKAEKKFENSRLNELYVEGKVKNVGEPPAEVEKQIRQEWAEYKSANKTKLEQEEIKYSQPIMDRRAEDRVISLHNALELEDKMEKRERFNIAKHLPSWLVPGERKNLPMQVVIGLTKDKNDLFLEKDSGNRKPPDKSYEAKSQIDYEYIRDKAEASGLEAKHGTTKNGEYFLTINGPTKEVMNFMKSHKNRVDDVSNRVETVKANQRAQAAQAAPAPPTAVAPRLR